VLPAYIRLEDDLDFGAAPWHGSDGPNPVYRMPLTRWGAVDRAVCDAALALGYGWSDDHNAPESSGVSPYAINGRDDRRVTVGDAYLEPARDRANLEIISDALVDRVLIEDGRATGVRARVAGEWVERRAREIIVSAGAIHSPAILQRSGIGPARWLEPLGIPVVRDAPCGTHLLDHPFVGVELALRPAARSAPDDRHTSCCVRYSSGHSGSDPNDMILMAINVSGMGERGLATGAIGASVFQSCSEGTVRIASADPDVPPAIELRLLSDARDLLRLRDGARRLFHLARHPLITRIAAAVRPWGTPAASIADLASDEALDEWLRATVNDCYHPAGTCRMGAPSDARAVVDPSCRVIGITGLRVIDASIMPRIVRANLQLTCVMIGEHMAERMAWRSTSDAQLRVPFATDQDDTSD
jgi:choline dehydrogenase